MRTILDPNDIHPTIKDEVANFQSYMQHRVVDMITYMVEEGYEPAKAV